MEEIGAPILEDYQSILGYMNDSKMDKDVEVHMYGSLESYYRE